MEPAPNVIAGKELERHHERFDALREFHALFNERGAVDERAIAILGAAFLDNMLEDILISFMVDDEREAGKLLGFDKALGTFSSRIAATYCLGLICKTVRDDLRIVAKIRNRFAHEVRASFDQPPFSDWCRSLKWHEFSMMMKAPADATPRETFRVGVNQLITYLSGLVSLARHDRRKVRNDDAGGPTLLR